MCVLLASVKAECALSAKRSGFSMLTTLSLKKINDEFDTVDCSMIAQNNKIADCEGVSMKCI